MSTGPSAARTSGNDQRHGKAGSLGHRYRISEPRQLTAGRGLDGYRPSTRTAPITPAAGLTPDTGTLAAGMATSGLLASWVADTARLPVGDLIEAAGRVAAGAEGLVLLPYFAGERSPSSIRTLAASLSG
jgi:sugar (pentulose or hexulose) kinase